ncbi:MAG TPA: helix-turn-helix transcriptional regulator [Candidatus Dormibacteraeota bacterium]|nr:helix-turn-helix transcriptional regulator [Candidatus Dormibacteraeota bacterium]
MSSALSVSADEIRRELGAILRGHREGQGQRLSEIAGEAGCSPAYLSEVERGLKDVSADLLIAITYALAVPIAAVYTDLGRRLGAWPQSEPAWSADPRRQLRAVTSGLDAASLRTVAQFGAFVAMNQAEPTRRRIGFVPPTAEGSR